MIIECPACGARAKLPDNKEGAKVRCAECERVYHARPSGARTAARSSSSAVPVGVGAGVVALVIVIFAITNRGPATTAAPPVEEAEERVFVAVDYGFDSPLCKFARGLHDAAALGDEFLLQSSIDTERVWERLQTATGGEELGRDDFMIGVLDSLLSKDTSNLVGTWIPFDGEVIEEGDTDAILRLVLQPRDAAATGGTRHIEWHLSRAGAQWKAWSWERWISPEEERNNRIARTRRNKKMTLSDGSVVLEAEPEPIAHLDSTPPELRGRIDEMIADLHGLDDLRPRELTHLRNELVVIGKPAVPALLTAMYELDEAGWTDETLIVGQQLHMLLQDITGYVTTFKAHEALGGTLERRDSGVRQWFSWYDRKFKRFEERAEETDLLETAIVPKTEREKRELEKYRRITEQERSDG
ncbi:MAG: zinc-ribbon domain-containing protein [Planctomycetota bacterium]|jgi:predicted Zn finger-like uncharacterized protein|nr:zinc-ribbon domain-containing protein [Planctomycetota bacterium]